MTKSETKPNTLVLQTENGQTLTIVDGPEEVTIRIAKDGHNRGIAKLKASDWQAALSHFTKVHKSR